MQGASQPARKAKATAAPMPTAPAARRTVVGLLAQLLARQLVEFDHLVGQRAAAGQIEGSAQRRGECASLAAGHAPARSAQALAQGARIAQAPGPGVLPILETLAEQHDLRHQGIVGDHHADGAEQGLQRGACSGVAVVCMEEGGATCGGGAGLQLLPAGGSTCGWRGCGCKRADWCSGGRLTGQARWLR